MCVVYIYVYIYRYMCCIYIYIYIYWLTDFETFRMMGTCNKIPKISKVHFCKRYFAKLKYITRLQNWFYKTH